MTLSSFDSRSGRFLRVVLFMLLPLLGGCASLREAQRTCALLVIVDGGRTLASQAQLARIEQRVQPHLTERGLVLSYDRRNAAWLARVEFTAAPGDPLDGDFAIRVIEPNPTLEIPTPTSDNPVSPGQRAQDEQFRRLEQQVMQEARKPTS